MLRESFEKHWNYIMKSLVNVNKGGTFAPATTRDVHWNTGKHKESKGKFIFWKRLKKACEIWKQMLHLHPAKQRKFIEILVRKWEEKEKKFSKKKLQNLLASWK